MSSRDELIRPAATSPETAASVTMAAMARQSLRLAIIAIAAPLIWAVVALNAHGDVVPPGEGWTHAPYGGEIEDGFIYGRGAMDMKSLGIAQFAFCGLSLGGMIAQVGSTVYDGSVRARLAALRRHRERNQ